MKKKIRMFHVEILLAKQNVQKKKYKIFLIFAKKII